MASFFWRYSFPSLLLLGIVAAQDKGEFITPSSAGSQNAFEVGQRLDIAWTEFEDYTLLSLGINQPNANLTLEWLISNARNYDNPFSWTVQTYGFEDLNERFAFYICNGTNFGSPFYSSYFRIEDSSAAARSSSASSSTTAIYTTISSNSTASTSLTTTTPAQTILPLPAASQVPASSGMSSGAKAGLAVGIAVAFVAGAGLMAWYMMRRSRRAHPQTPVYAHEVHAGHHGAYASGAIGHSGPAMIHEGDSSWSQGKSAVAITPELDSTAPAQR